jgi:mRNA-degrading endonuclease RelE of RelBE toxin-antitoxin system
LKVVLTREAQDDIEPLDAAVRQRILDRLQWIGDNAGLLRHQPLRGRERGGSFRYRIGDYRVIHQIDRPANRLIVLKLGIVVTDMTDVPQAERQRVARTA